MSFGQWRLWFLEQLRPGTNAWNTPIIARLRGELDVEALRRSLALLVERHATLRTVYPAPDSRPAPVVRDPPPDFGLPLEEVDEDELLARIEEEVRRPFDLRSDLMLRARLLRSAAAEHVLVVVVHHIACDGWSKGVLIRELGAAYGAISTGSEPALGQLTVEYADFAAWQRAWLQDQTLDRLRAYWGERLAGHPGVLELPTDLPRPAIQRFRGVARRLIVPGPLADAVIAIGRRERATAFMSLMAAFTVFLSAQTGEEDILVGSPAAMRTEPELEGVVGLFVNTLVYRTDLGGEPSFRELIGRVRESALGVYQHQDLPFEQIVEVLRPKRDPSRNPLVQANLRVEGREPELRLRGLESEPLVIDPGLARFDLAIELSAADDGYEGYLECDTSLFSEPTIDRLVRDFGAVLAAVAATPDTPVLRLGVVRAVRAGARVRS